ncbi:hypothetical protein RIF29_20890 [Crotalaria pallida]|uniref:Uncharacterized protein n=1 Tax=Crotalaria pallida TaxID=3830 RepID=A0AAN9F233_CROPI
MARLKRTAQTIRLEEESRRQTAKQVEEKDTTLDKAHESPDAARATVDVELLIASTGVALTEGSDDAPILDTPSSGPLDQPATESSDDIDITAIVADAAAQVEALDETHPHADALEEPHSQVEALQAPDAPHTSPSSSSQTCPFAAKHQLHPGSEPSSSSSDPDSGSG